MDIGENQLVMNKSNHGTPERVKFDDEAYAFYTGQILLQARKEAKITQSELAKRISSTKSY
jgi:hypothetical protein